MAHEPQASVLLMFLLYFRLNGSYEALEAGNIADALVDFTGGVCESINLKDANYNDDEERRLEFFKSMQKSMSDRSLIGASISVNNTELLLFLFVCLFIYLFTLLLICIWF